MAAAVLPFGDRFITPMAAVAGAVADEICHEMTVGGGLRRAYVNDGGDIALYLSPGTSFDVGVVAVPERPALLGKATLRSDDPVRGVATSGRHGRSFSLGIADSVTVLAADAARADAAATLIANAVDLPGHPAIRRMPASELDPDSDLGERMVTVEVGALGSDEVARALERGVDEAERMRARRPDRRLGAGLGGSGLPGRGSVGARASVRRRGVMATDIRKIVSIVEDVRREAGRPVDPAVRRVVTAAVLANPFAGGYVEDLSPLIAESVELSRMLSEIAVAHLDGRTVHSYGKGGIVGTKGELEHVAAMLHPEFGAPCGRPAAAARRSSPRRRSVARRGRRSTYPCITRMRRSSAAISTRWSSASPTPPTTTSW